MKTSQDAPIEVTDARPFDYFWISREIGRPSPNGQTWAALLQPTCVSIYNILCLHTNAKRDEQREAFPSYATIAKECGISRQSAIDGIAKLIAFGFIAVKPSTSKYRTNIFIIQPVEKWVVAASCGRKPRQDKGSSNPKRHHNKLNDSQSDRLSEKTEIVNQIDSDSQSDRLLIVNQIDSDSQSDRPEVKSVSKAIKEKSGSTSSSSKSSSSIERAEKTEEEEGQKIFDQNLSSLLTPEQIQKIHEFYLLGKDEVEGFLIRNNTSFTELCKCLDAIVAKDMAGSTARYVDFQGRPIQRPLGFVFKNGWITAGRACVPTLHAPEIKKERTRWNNQDINDMELEKTRKRLRAQGVDV